MSTKLQELYNLQPLDVIVFGSNSTGFHGAGMAGLAFRNDGANTWREDQKFLDAMNAPKFHPNTIGYYAQYGVSKGLTKGSHGYAYAIVTIERPGKRRSVSLQSIKDQVNVMIELSKSHNELRFIVTEIGCNYAGFTVSEIAPLFLDVLNNTRFVLPKSFITELNNERQIRI